MKQTLIVVPILLFTACSSFDRSAKSGYASTSEKVSFLRQQSDEENQLQRETSRELGGATEDRAIVDRIALKKLEKRIESRKEREAYYKAKPALRTDRDRIQYLTLYRNSDRESFLAQRGIAGEAVENPPEVQELIDHNDIGYGMTRQAVKESWGPPEFVEVAGDPVFGNEIWHYREQTTSSEGYASELRKVIFENGTVVGWQTK